MELKVEQNQLFSLYDETSAKETQYNQIFSEHEEKFNTLTHQIAFILSLIGLCFLVVFSSINGSIWHIIGCSIFGAGLCCLYFVSTQYHSSKDEEEKEFFRILDHICIYILIAATYTPFTLTYLRGDIGWTLFFLEWGMAAIGITIKLRYKFRYNIITTFGYLAMGWLIIIAIEPMLLLFPREAFTWLVLGGVSYSFGVIFYLNDERIPYFHVVWHIFVMLGSLCHFIAVFCYVIP